MGLVPGVLVLNLALLAVGYCVLASSLRGSPLRRWASWAGVALLVGAGLVCTGMFVALTLGTTSGPLTFAVVAALVAAAGAVAAAFLPTDARAAVGVPADSTHRASSRLARAVTIAAGYGVVAIAIMILVGGFRSSPWLDDVWGIWLPKGIALDHLGLDHRLFTEGGQYVGFEVLSYPLWWSILGALDMRAVGEIDLRAVDAQLAALSVAFVAAAARLLFGLLRPWLLACGLLLLVACPEFLRQIHGGVADLPLAIYLALALLAAAGWLASRRAFYLVLVAVFGAAALAIKSEGLPQFALLLVVVSLFAWPTARRRLPALWAAAAVAFATEIPWAIWRSANDVRSQVPLSDAFDPGRLFGQTERVRPAAETVLRHLASPSQWLLLVPLAFALSVAGAIRSRSWLWLAPAATLAAGYAFWIFAYWAESEDLSYLLATSSYRVIDGLVLVAALLVPLQVEFLLRLRREPPRTPPPLRR